MSCTGCGSRAWRIARVCRAALTPGARQSIPLFRATNDARQGPSLLSRRGGSYFHRLDCRQPDFIGRVDSLADSESQKTALATRDASLVAFHGLDAGIACILARSARGH